MRKYFKLSNKVTTSFLLNLGLGLSTITCKKIISPGLSPGVRLTDLVSEGVHGKEILELINFTVDLGRDFREEPCQCHHHEGLK